MFGFFKSAEKRWKESYNALAEEKITAQDFVDINEGMTLFYTPPLLLVIKTDPNVLTHFR